MSKEAKYFAFAAICIPVGGAMLSGGIAWGWFIIGLGLVLGFLALRIKPKETIVTVVATEVITVENYDYERKAENCIHSRHHSTLLLFYVLCL